MVAPHPTWSTRMRGLAAHHLATALGALLALACLAALMTGAARAAPYAAIVMDARDGRVLYERNADARLHPASLTKMLTLYIAFDAIERGEIDVDHKVTISANAAAEPPSSLGLSKGHKISMRHLIRAAALRSANDAATAIGEAISGSEAAFAERMNRTARALGMTSSNFRNANGLTRDGHLSTARDMNILGRRLIYDFPGYYSIFSRREDSAGIARVANTNRRFLAAYRGSDGIKTGFTNAAGYNLTASAERGGKRVVATIFGGTSTPMRNKKMAELLDIGFQRAADRVAVSLPPVSLDRAVALRANGASTAPRPRPRPAALTTDAPTALIAAVEPPPPPPDALTQDTEVAPELEGDTVALALAEAVGVEIGEGDGNEPDVPEILMAAAAPPPSAPAVAAATATTSAPVRAIPPPRPRPGEIVMTAAARPGGQGAAPAGAPALTPEVIAAAAADVGAIVAQISTSGARHWGVSLGKFRSQATAERLLLQTALAEPLALDGGLRQVMTRPSGYEAAFLGLGHDQADLVCRRLRARGTGCDVIGP